MRNLDTPIVLCSAYRTPIGKFSGQFAHTSAVELGTQIIASSLKQLSLDPSLIDLVLMGHARQAGCGPNPARQASIFAGIPESTPAFTLNQACASGLATVLSAVRHILLGEATAVLAGGMENMSQVPYILKKQRWGQKMGHMEVTDLMYQDGFGCPMAEMIMGETAELLATKYEITREQQDAYALESQQRCQKAREADLFSHEILPVQTKAGEISKDEHPRDNLTLEKLAKLRPVYGPEGTVTAANASGITDGASCTLITTLDFAQKHNLPILAFYQGGLTIGLSPKEMGLGPAVVMKRYFAQKETPNWDDKTLFELNEAFAAQVLACQKEYPLPHQQLNLFGGSIALGHPIGCSGNRILCTGNNILQHQERFDRLITTLCVSGGLGILADWKKA